MIKGLSGEVSLSSCHRTLWLNMRNTGKKRKQGYPIFSSKDEIFHAKIVTDAKNFCNCMKNIEKVCFGIFVAITSGLESLTNLLN